MPELPEVETVRRGIEEIIPLPTQIERIEVVRRDLRVPVPKELEKTFNGAQLEAIRRRAKFLLFDTNRGTLINHLGMTGSWRLLEKDERLKHDHLLLHLSNHQSLVFHDPRRFGLVEMAALRHEQDNRWLKHLGPEPLDHETFTGEYLYQKSRGRTSTIKGLIMDQRIVVGVGNIYASEALYLSGIRPSLAAGRVSRARMDKLVECIHQVLEVAIKAGGTTIRDFRQAGGTEGYFQQQLRVYGRSGESCSQCQKRIKSAVVAGRNTFWCPQCQK